MTKNAYSFPQTLEIIATLILGLDIYHLASLLFLVYH